LAAGDSRREAWIAVVVGSSRQVRGIVRVALVVEEQMAWGQTVAAAEGIVVEEAGIAWATEAYPRAAGILREVGALAVDQVE